MATNLNSKSANPVVFSLEPGDRLTRSEFEARYQSQPGIKKAELIEGVVHMPSPVRYERHGRPHAMLITWLGTYESITPGVAVADNATARLDLDNEPQPDAILLIDPKCGGQASISADDYIELAPELVVEIASSSSSFDMHSKLEVYRRCGVREYVVWRVLDNDLDWFTRVEDSFQLIPIDEEGLLSSKTFPGLRLNKAALLSGRLVDVLECVRSAVLLVEHQAFCQRLSVQTSRDSNA
jgi:Uma2 family endonuclease